MKKAFTLLEFTFSCVIFALLFVLISKTLKENYHFNLKISESHQMLLDLNQALLNYKAYLINSTLILDNNTSLYSPKSQFLKILQNRKDLFKDDEKRLYVLVQDEIKTLQILSNKNVKADFVGIFIPLEARLDLILKNTKIEYELRPKFHNDSLKQSGILAQNVSVFEFQNRAGNLILKICMQKGTFNQCLQKRLYL